jgi:prepilin-type N-terminal cleavage/methylation domain-containing protein
MQMKPNSTLRRFQAGFSLMELLIVMVIIVVLVAIGIPISKNMRANAQRNQCLQQVRSWGVAIAGYAADHDGRVQWRNWAQISWVEADASPYNHYWTGGSISFEDRQDEGAFANQLRMRRCPATPMVDKTKNPTPNYSMIRPTYNGTIVSEIVYPLSRLRNPSRFIMMIEALDNNGNTPIISGAELATKVKPLTQKGTLLRHNTFTVNTLFGDYSVRPMTWKELEKGSAYWTQM